MTFRKTINVIVLVHYLERLAQVILDINEIVEEFIRIIK